MDPAGGRPSTWGGCSGEWGSGLVWTAKGRASKKTPCTALDVPRACEWFTTWDRAGRAVSGNESFDRLRGRERGREPEGQAKAGRSG